MQFRRILTTISPVLLLAGLAACDNDPDRGSDLGPIQPPDPIPATRYVSDVAMDGTSATYVADAVPTGEGAAPEVAGSSWFVRGGQMVMNVTVDDTATELYVTVSNADVGYYSIPLTGMAFEAGLARADALRAKQRAAGIAIDEPEISAFRAPRTVTVTLTPSDTASSFTVSVRSTDGTTVSAAAGNRVEVNTTASSSAELQASLNWIDPIDYDLHLVTPDGNRIYFAVRTGQNGGELDLDSNPACFLDNVNNENITWAGTSPAAGQYSLELDLWSACELPGPFPYLVTLVIGGEAQTFEGSMLASAEDNFEPTVITTFTIE